MSDGERSRDLARARNGASRVEGVSGLRIGACGGKDT